MIFRKKREVTDIQNTMLHKKLNFAATEAYNLLRTNLMFSVPDEGRCRVISVTSAVRGEGKSTTAINLSYSLCENGKRVLLIDADLRLPTVAKKLDIKSTPGLSNVIAGMVKPDEAIYVSPERENWCIIPAGDIPPNPTELLSSAQMKSLVKELAESYDFIVIDVPPVNIVSDALVVSEIVDGFIVVVRENYSSRGELRGCMRQLSLAASKVIGFVMTGVGSEDKTYKKYRYKKYGKYGKYKGEYKDYSDVSSNK